jgi:thioesterase domain-containing protein
MAKRLKRKGRTVTFSISVDPATKKLLRDVAERSYQGNVSELITQIAEQAARQDAAAELLKLHGRPVMTDEECDEFEREVAAELAGRSSGRKRRHRAA